MGGVVDGDLAFWGGLLLVLDQSYSYVLRCPTQLPLIESISGDVSWVDLQGSGARRALQKPIYHARERVLLESSRVGKSSVVSGARASSISLLNTAVIGSLHNTRCTQLG